ncbi:MAG: hypothetical protein ACOCU5_02645 [Bacillota bacterium]
MIPFMIGFMVSLALILYAYHLRILSTSGSVALLFMGTLIFGFTGFFSYLGLVSLFAPPAILFYLNESDGPMIKARSIISFSIFPVFFATLYFLLPAPTWLFYTALSYSIVALDLWRRSVSGRFSPHAYTLYRFKRTDSDTPGSVSSYGALGAASSTLFFLVYGYFFLPGSEPFMLLLAGNGMMYFLILNLGLLKRHLATHEHFPFNLETAIHFDEPMLRFLSSALSILFIAILLSFIA